MNTSSHQARLFILFLKFSNEQLLMHTRECYSKERETESEGGILATISQCFSSNIIRARRCRSFISIESVSKGPYRCNCSLHYTLKCSLCVPTSRHMNGNSLCSLSDLRVGHDKPHA
jgi:hypothetical protein